MVPGFNHNVRYKGEIFHVQTEDSGVATPRIVTLLYRGGVIIASKKTNYADIIKIENLGAVIGELMKEQHKEMMRRLKSGEFDQRVFQPQPSVTGSGTLKPAAPSADTVAGISPAHPASPKPSSGKSDFSFLFSTPVQQREGTAGLQPADRDNTAKKEVNLDDAILSFFVTNEK